MTTPRRILVVDNLASIREVWKTLLELEGYEVYEAATAEEAIAVTEQKLIHLALVDVRLVEDEDDNDESGLDLCKRLDPSIARIVVTGYPWAWRVVRDAFMTTERQHRAADGFLAKEEVAERLLTEVRRVLVESFEIIPDRRIAVLTSGGDAPGMNAAVQSVVRIAMAHNIEVMGVHDGYRGLVENRMRKLTWNEVSDIVVQGGTILGAARYPGFANPDTRAVAVDNLLRKHITGLIVIGGDGSMQGAKVLAADVQARGRPFQTVAIPGTIDNDLWGTDMSLGAASAANAMIEELRNMVRPAQALQRIFIGEVMGRYSGYLALEAALGVGADAVILPEQVIEVFPATSSNPGHWKARFSLLQTEEKFLAQVGRIAATLEGAFTAGKRYGFVVLAEGIGQLTDGKLDGANVRQLLENEIQRWTSPCRPDVRAHVLGYPVRGGPPCRFDIWLGAKLGAAAVQCLLEPDKTDVMVGWSEEDGILETPFDEAIAKSNRPPGEIWQDRPKWRESLELLDALARPPAL